MPGWRLACLAAGMVMAGLPTASANWLAFVDGLPALSASDIEIIQQTARVDMADEIAGTSLSWSNPETGASGTVLLVRRFEYQGLPCQHNFHEVLVPGTAPFRAEVSVCQLENGEWRLLEFPSR